MKRIFLLGFMSILGLGLSSAQDSFSIKGQVHSAASGSPVESGVVNLVDRGSLSLISFEQINPQGEFEFWIDSNLDLQSVFFSIESLGFQSLQFGLDSLPKSGDWVVSLEPMAYQLDEVIIEDMPSVRQSIDTIAFDPRAYSDSTERTLEDILKKLPGVDVSKDGKINLGNQEIRSILLDGDDLGGSDYRVISQNLPIELVQRLEFVSNYVGNTLLAGFDVPEALVLNVVLDEEKTRKPSLNLTFGLGTADNQELAFNSLAFSKKIKLVNIGRFQTVGDRLLPPLTRPWEELEGVLDSHPLLHGDDIELTYRQPSISIPSDFIPFRFNSTSWGISRLHFKPSKKVKSLVEVGLGKDRAGRFMDVDRTFLVGQGSFKIEESYELESLAQNLNLQVKNQIYTGEKSNLTTFSRLSRLGDQSGSELSLESNDFDISFEKQKFRQDHRIAWIRRMDDHNILILDGGLSIHSLNQGLLIESSKPRLILPQNMISKIEQDINLGMLHLNGNVRWLKKVNRNLSVYAALKYATQNESFLGTRYKKQVVNGDLKLKYRAKRSFFALMNIQSGLLKLESMESAINQTGSLNREPYIFARAVLGRKQLQYNWNFSYTFRQVLPTLDQVNRNLYWTTYRTLSLGDSVLRIGNSHNLMGRVAFNSNLTRLNRFTSYASIRLSLGMIPYQNVYTLDSIALIDRWGEGESRVRQVGILTGIERYFAAIKTAFKLKPGFTYSTYNNLLEDESRTLHSFNWNLNYSMRSATSLPFDFMLGGRSSWNEILVSTSLMSTTVSSFSVSAYGDLMIHLARGIEFIFRNEWIHIANQNQPTQNFSFQEFELEIPAYESSKIKFDIDLLGRNLRDVEYFGINSVTDYLVISNRIRLRPRTFMVRLRLGF